MLQSTSRSLAALCGAALLSATAACDSGNTAATPTPPTPAPTVTETFSGALGQNGAVTFNFTIAAAGQVTARLSAVTPDATIALGLSLGEWNGFTCEIKIAKDNALVGSTILGNVSGPGILCARVYDAGKIPDPNPDPVRLSFEIVVIHP